jgi:hypothetical protein
MAVATDKNYTHWGGGGLRVLKTRNMYFYGQL